MSRRAKRRFSRASKKRERKNKLEEREESNFASENRIVSLELEMRNDLEASSAGPIRKEHLTKDEVLMRYKQK